MTQTSQGVAPPLQAGKAPVGPGAISLLGIVLSILAIALGVIGVRDALISADLIQGKTWLEGGIKLVDGWQPQWWAVPVGLIAAVLGLWFLVVALRPRPRRSVSLRSGTGIFIAPRDVRKIVTQAAEDVDGVLSVSVSANRKLIRIVASVTADDGTIAGEIRQRVEHALTAVDKAPRVKVKTDTRELT